jgi:UDP-N-acetylglucosamine 2-epimerase (non-hydrolysing)
MAQASKRRAEGRKPRRRSRGDPGPIAVLIGTRPEAIKLMPVIRALEEAGRRPEVYLTGQHDALLRPILADLRITPTADLKLLQPGQSLGHLAGRIVEGVERLLHERRPSVLLVQGDTTSVAMGALAGFYEDVPVAHVEAGLRSGAARNPFPEEMNRRLAGRLATLHFAPTVRARANLLAEGVDAERIHVVGNTVIDALFYARAHLIGQVAPDPSIEKREGERLVLVTAHRRESFGPDLRALFEGVRRVASHGSPRLRVVFPVHLNPNVQSAARAVLAGSDNVQLLRPLSYLRFVRVLVGADLVITDSGGVLEEASALGIPTLVVRRTTERGEAMEAGVAELVPPEAQAVFTRAIRLLIDPRAYRARARPTAVFGDGHAAERIVEVLGQR